MDPRDFLAVAINLGASTDEAHRRTAVSRAYYALFLNARRMLEVESLPLGHLHDDHRLVPEYFRDAGDERLADVGDAIADLRRERNLADYDMDAAKFNQALCALLVEKARASIQVLNGLNREARRAMVGAIRARRNL
jgi:uncharacterized protein (UPF0332 family)